MGDSPLYDELIWSNVPALVIAFVVTLVICGVLAYLLAGVSRQILLGVIALLLACVVFLPVFIVAKWGVNSVIYGSHYYRSAAEISDPRIVKSLPADARDIELHENRYGNGFVAKYYISLPDLEAYLVDKWNRVGIVTAQVCKPPRALSGWEYDDFIYYFGAMAWQVPRRSSVCRSPRSANGVHAVYYFDLDNEIVYERAAY